MALKSTRNRIVAGITATVAAVAAAVMLTVGSDVTLPPESQIIIGPQAALTNSWFDTTQIERIKVHVQGCTNPVPTDAEGLDRFANDNYYDLTLTAYIAAQRANDPALLTAARNCGDRWWKHPTWINEGKIRKFPDEATPSPRHAGIAGLTLRAIDGRPEMWDWINAYTRAAFDNWIKIRVSGSQLHYGVRESSFVLHDAARLAQVLPDSFPLQAGGTATNGAQLRAQYIADIEHAIVNYFGRLQQADGSWRWDTAADEYIDKVGTPLTASVAVNATSLTVAPLPYPIAADMLVDLPDNRQVRTTAAAPAGATVIATTPVLAALPSGKDVYVHDGTLKGITQPFMMGLLMSALVDADQVVASPTAKTSLRQQVFKSCRYLFDGGPYIKDGIATHFGKKVRGFHYFREGGTSVNPTKYEKGDFPFNTTVAWHIPGARQAISTIAAAYGAAYLWSGDLYYKLAGDELWDAAYGGGDGIYSMANDTSKNYSQHYRFAGRYLVWRGGGALPSPSATSTPVASVSPSAVPSLSPSPLPSPTSGIPSSPNPTKSTRIIDSAGGEWTIDSERRTLRNGAHMGQGYGVMYKWLDGVVYVMTTDNRTWYRWEGGWVELGWQEPGGALPTPTSTPTATSTPTPQPSPTAQPTATPTPSPTATATPLPYCRSGERPVRCRCRSGVRQNGKCW